MGKAHSDAQVSLLICCIGNSPRFSHDAALSTIALPQSDGPKRGPGISWQLYTRIGLV